jgi:hypothetical protein
MITIVIVITLGLIHFSYVDFRFRYRDGFQWFWRLSPAPPMMWIGRVSIVAAILFAFAFHFMADRQLFGIVLGALVGVHIISLILLELLEPRS